MGYAEEYIRIERALAKDVGEDPVNEMPHLESEDGPIDLRIERYPMPQAGKSRLMQDFQKTGLAGQRDGKWLHFQSDHTVKEITPQQAADLPQLPDDWDTFAVVAKGDGTPSMRDVFGSKKK